MTDEIEWTTITVPKPVKEDLDSHRDGRSWGSYLETLRREHADPLTMNDAEQLAEYLEKRLESTDVDSRELGEATADYLMAEYNLPQKVADRLQQ